MFVKWLQQAFWGAGRPHLITPPETDSWSCPRSSLPQWRVQPMLNQGAGLMLSAPSPPHLHPSHHARFYFRAVQREGRLGRSKPLSFERQSVFLMPLSRPGAPRPRPMIGPRLFCRSSQHRFRTLWILNPWIKRTHCSLFEAHFDQRLRRNQGVGRWCDGLVWWQKINA